MNELKGIVVYVYRSFVRLVLTDITFEGNYDIYINFRIPSYGVRILVRLS